MGSERLQKLVYDDPSTAVIELFSGEGFLSPGGPEEVAEMLGPVDITDKTVLDFGCGIGGIDIALIRNHRAGKVVGIDVSEAAIRQARERASKHGIEHRLAFQLIEPGRLPFDDATFDIGFSSGAILFVPDKAEIFRELFRVLRLGGWLVVNDWYRSEAEFSIKVQEWVQMTGSEHMETLKNTRKIVEECGFKQITTRERNAWYREQVDRELACLRDAYDTIVELVGEEEARSWINAGQLRKVAVHEGHIRPAHLKGAKMIRMHEAHPSLPRDRWLSSGTDQPRR